MEIIREVAAEDGFEKGEITGINKGLQQGIIDTAKKLLELKIPMEQITSSITRNLYNLRT